MGDLIPRDAAAAVCDKHSYSNNPYVSGRMADAAAEIRAIPTIDPAAIREAALEACTIIDAAAKEGHKNPLDLFLHLLSAVEPARRALALIGEKK